MSLSADLGEVKEVDLAQGTIRYRERGTGAAQSRLKVPDFFSSTKEIAMVRDKKKPNRTALPGTES